MKKQADTIDVGVAELPQWVPGAARNYLLHTVTGVSIRKLARICDCHASTVMRQVHRIESQRDDILVDEALSRLGQTYLQVSRSSAEQNKKDATKMTIPHSTSAQMRNSDADDQSQFAACNDQSTTAPNPKKLRREKDERRVLTRLSENGAVLVVAGDLDKAVVVRSLPGGKSARTAVVEREVAQSMALKDLISCAAKGKVTQYKITTAGRAALKRMISTGDPAQPGFSDMQASFGDQHRVWGEKQLASGCEQEQPKHIRYNIAESPLAGLARRRDKDGKPFLSDDLVHVGERLREDFELAQMGPRVAQNWERFLTGGGRGGFAADSGVGHGPEEARRRVSGALEHLGPGLGDVVLRCCCYLEGMEAAEKRMGWSARSGKVVLRIALQRLKRHYDETHGKFGPMIG
ncbi:DUF6456 domain-containing protein [Halocynthiibacter namhaensis]|uniref:DUF6456 domain-containing protein n=1 Tax=Halocynthiibacter namhaensis TaxID=1290553 RepID=UPI0005798389|nr:DUF6456 domain-containing protein [Halocynthiibacter namhaensis]